jgi:hypothetical protein
MWRRVGERSYDTYREATVRPLVDTARPVDERMRGGSSRRGEGGCDVEDPPDDRSSLDGLRGPTFRP